MSDLQLREAIGEFAPADEELEAVGQERVAIGGARQRRDLGRVRMDEGRVEQRVLAGLLEDLDLQLAGAIAGLERDAEARASLAQVGHVAQPRGVEARIVLEDHAGDGHATERLRQVIRPALGLELQLADHGLGRAAHHPLDQVHQVTVVRVGLVELEHREFGVVPRRQTLVAEVAVDLVDPLEAADHEALQVQLGRDPQVHLLVERVVVRDERPRGRAARYRLHHRRLDLEEVEGIERIPEVGDDARARAEHLARGLVHDEVDVALAIARLGVGQAMPLVGQRPQRLGQQPHLLHAHRQLARARAEQRQDSIVPDRFEHRGRPPRFPRGR